MTTLSRPPPHFLIDSSSLSSSRVATRNLVSSFTQIIKPLSQTARMAPGTFRAAASSAVHSGGSFGGIDSQAQQHADPGGSRNAQSSGVVVAEKYGLLAAVIAARGGCAVLDGGLATELELRGADLNDPLWSAKCLMEEEASSLVRKVHLDYYRAGADISISASYQATIEGFTARGLSKGQAEALLARSVQLVGEARDRFWAQYCAEAERRGERVERAEGGVERVAGRVKPLVAASVGSYGAFLADGSEYSGDYGADMTVERLMDFHRRRLQVLAAAGPDIIAMETIPCHIEAQALVQLLEEQAASGAAAVPAWISFNSKDGRTAPSGDLFSSCIATAAASPHVVAVGINCTPPRFILPLLHAARKETSKPLVVYPNSGEAWDGINKEWVPCSGLSDDGFVSYAPEWVSAGAAVLGGCCRTTPHTIFSIAECIHCRGEKGAGWKRVGPIVVRTDTEVDAAVAI